MIERTGILLINTCGPRGFAASADQSAVTGVVQLPNQGTSEAILPALLRLFPDGLAALDVVAVVNGPGSFTGARVGLSTAKGLCEAGACKLVVLSRLALVAGVSHAQQVLAVLDAGRGEFYVGMFSDGRCVSEKLLSRGEIEALLLRGGAVTCEATVVERLGERVRLVSEPEEGLMLSLAVRRISAAEWSDVATVDANYIRRTDAERLRDPR